MVLSLFGAWLVRREGLAVLQRLRELAVQSANDTNTEFAGGYALAHLRWSTRFNLGPADALELLARVDNVFDRVYSGSVIVNDGNSRYYETGSPRAGLLSVRWLHRWCFWRCVPRRPNWPGWPRMSVSVRRCGWR